MDNDDTPQVSPGVAPAPGTVPDQAARRNLGLADSTAAWTNANGAYSRPLMDNANSMAARVAGVQADTMDFNRGAAQENLDFQNETFRPLQRGIVADAVGYDTPERREQQAGQAMADVGTQADMARETVMRNQEARGVDPSSGSTAIALSRAAIGEGAAKAAAGNTARLQVEQTGADRKMAANSLGNSLAGNAAAYSGLATGAGSAAVNTTAAPLQLQSQQLQGFNALTNTGISANTAAGTLMRPAGAGATTSGGSGDSTNRALGALVGQAAGAYFGGLAKGGKVGLADVRGPAGEPRQGMVNLDVGEYRIAAKRARELGTAALKALNEGRATVVMKRA